ncbi:MAG TPA: ATP-binding protein [Ktedonobacterales bacterium]|nr:ATP-binding protein [Ktedonobacterales bacterium]
MGFVRAIKTASRLRMALIGPSGSGKTWTALALATALADGKEVAVIDTERGSASKYADIFPPFDVLNLDTFSPESYIEAIHAAEEGGYGVLVIDSISHEWAGPGGILEIVDGVARRNKGGNSFAAWGEVTPRHNRFIDAITRARLHVIVTIRSKQEYVLDKDERTGRTTPRKVGLAPIQRAHVEYEMDIAADMDIDHTLIVQKSRCPALANAVIARPGADLAETLRAWLQGVPPAEAERAALVAQITSLRAAVGEAAPDPAGMEQATDEQLRRERTRLTTKHAEAAH